MEYKSFYAFEVIGELMNGTPIFALDKKNNNVYDLQKLPIRVICKTLEIAKEQDRVLFYSVEERGTENV